MGLLCVRQASLSESSRLGPHNGGFYQKRSGGAFCSDESYFSVSEAYFQFLSCKLSKVSVISILCNELHTAFLSKVPICCPGTCILLGAAGGNKQVH